MKTTLITLILIFFTCLSISAQTNDEKARTKYLQAKEAYSQGKYNYAASYLVDAKLLLGKTNIKIQPLLVKCFVQLGNWSVAKHAVQEYYALNPDKNLVEYAEIVALEKEIDKHLPKEIVTQPNVTKPNTTGNAPKSNTGSTVYSVVEEMPEFPGGENGIMTFLAANMKYPPVAAENGIQGKVIARFVVQKDGSIGEVEIVRSLDPSCDREVIRLIKSMPLWKPGILNNKPVSVWYSLPVNFRLQE